MNLWSSVTSTLSVNLFWSALCAKSCRVFKRSAIAESLDVGTASIERVRKQFVEEGLDAALVRRTSRRVYRRKLDGDDEAHLIALACSDPLAGRGRWTLRLLAERMVTLEYVESVSKDTVHRVLKKTNLSLG